MNDIDSNKIKENMLKVMKESERMREDWTSRTAPSTNNIIIQVPQKFQHWFGIDCVTTLGLNGSLTVVGPDRYEQMVKDSTESWEALNGQIGSNNTNSMFDNGIKSLITEDGLLSLPNDWSGIEEIRKSQNIFFIDSGAELFILKGHRVCKCNEPLCGKCLGANCEDPFCPTHNIIKKIIRRKQKEELKNYQLIINKIERNIMEYNENGYFEVLGESLSVKHFPKLHRMYMTSKSNLERQLKSIADTWHEGYVMSAAQAFESDLQHG